MEDERTKRAVAMTLINIGELVKIIPQEFRKKHEYIPWREAAGLRDIAAHHYQTLRMEDIWVTISEDLMEFKKVIQEILPSNNANNRR